MRMYTMGFGLTNAPYSFQKAMSNFFGDLEYMKVYLNDILIHSRTETEHLDHLQEFFTRVKENNISVSSEKSQFFLDGSILFGT